MSPLTKLNAFRNLLEENMLRLTDQSHMSDLVPLVVVTQEKSEISGKPVSVIFDGTTRLGEAMAIVVRFTNSSFVIQQCLIHLQLLVKSMSGEEIARELINTLTAQYSISCDLLVAAIHNRAACNMVALRTLTVVLPNIVDVGCFSHALDLGDTHTASSIFHGVVDKPL